MKGIVIGVAIGVALGVAAGLLGALGDALAPSIESASSTLIDFGEPNGNGVAFAKFLAIYERLTTASEPEAPEPGELVDTEA